MKAARLTGALREIDCGSTPGAGYEHVFSDFRSPPQQENWDEYLDNAKMLRPELEQEEGFVDNIRYKS